MSKRRLNRPILKYEIEEAQKHSRSASEAARYLKVDFRTYKKYAEIYGIYENLLNKTGIGTDKGFAKNAKNIVKLKDVFAGLHPKYPLQRLRWRMVSRGLIEDKCEQCGMEEERLSDGKRPLLLTWRGEPGNWHPSNFIMLCYNCVFLTKDAPSVVNKKSVNRAVKRPDSLKSTDKYLNPDVKKKLPEPAGDLSDDDIAALKREIDQQLGRA